MRQLSLFLVPAALLVSALAGCGRPPTPGAAVPTQRDAADTRPTPAEQAAARFRVEERASGTWIDTGKLAPPAARPDGPAGGAEAPMSSPVPADRVGGPTAGSPGAVPARPAGFGEREWAKKARLPEALAVREGMGEGRTPGKEGALRAGEEAALRAGEVDDNRLFEKYLEYARKYEAGGGVHRFDAAERHRIRVVNARGIGVPDAQVLVAAAGQPGEPGRQGLLFRARTAASGEAVFFPEAVGVPVPRALSVTVRKDDLAGSASVERDAKGGTWTVQLPDAPDTYTGMTLDLLFLVDTTGSMSEEISRVRDTIRSVSAEIRALPSRPRLRLGMVLYRDREDEYVTRRRAFTEDVDAFQAALKEVRADGGGDEPEDLNAGLQQAIEAMDWTPASAVRILFAIADAPPHLDYAEEYDYFLGAQRAAEKGIKVVGVSTMGTNDVGEFVFRQLSLLTQGRFMFVTRGEGGETPHHVARQDYTVQRLDSLIVKLVSEELAALGQKPQVAFGRE